MKKIVFISMFVIITCIVLFVELSGIVYHNDILASIYSVHGIDVSHHKYRINWSKIDKNKFTFAIIKATEGSDFQDKDYKYNYKSAKDNDFIVGSFHFFSMLSSGEDQANFYISKVPKDELDLPPIIDFEIPTKYDKKIVLKELKSLIYRLENHYQKKVIIYVTRHTYKAYIKDEFLDNPLWVREIKFYPLNFDNRWSIWQYSNRGRISGIGGFTDKNAYRFKNIEEFIENNRIK